MEMGRIRNIGANTVAFWFTIEKKNAKCAGNCIIFINVSFLTIYRLSYKESN